MIINALKGIRDGNCPTFFGPAGSFPSLMRTENSVNDKALVRQRQRFVGIRRWCQSVQRECALAIAEAAFQ